MRSVLVLAALALLSACNMDTGPSSEEAAQEKARLLALAVSPPMRWEHKSGSDEWTAATLAALEREGVTMLSNVPHDIGTYCPNYAELTKVERKAFWAGFMSALAKHESTYNPMAAGGGGRWLGLMQIAPGTWRSYGCSGHITDGADNMACAVRIMSKQVGRDNAVARDGSGGWRGVARDWGPMRSAAKRADIAAWTSSQSYCTAKTES
ncbi:transglycosylase SLT domain-containing protein [Paracoccus alkanivorans]|nr:transglycosylase SLT domain-containing protein [Paracoccus alkanivorans]